MANSDATKITTFVGIDGEREYKKALEEMGREMRALASEGKKLEAVYADNANSLLFTLLPSTKICASGGRNASHSIAAAPSKS